MTEIIYKCRQVVGVNSLLLLKKEDSFVCLKEQHTKNEADCFFQNFWIALALNEARKKLIMSHLFFIQEISVANGLKNLTWT